MSEHSLEGAGGGADHDHLYALNRRSYPVAFLPVFRRIGIEPCLLVQFPITLPFHIPLEERSAISYEIDDASACTLHFSSLTVSRQVRAGMVDEPAAIDVPLTRVEMIFATSNSAFEIGERALSDVFDTLVRYLNTLLGAYIIVSKDFRVYRVSREMLDFASVYRIIRPDQWDAASTGLFLLHFELPAGRKPIDGATQARIVHLSYAVHRGLNPFILSEQYALTARRHAVAGSYAESVIAAQTSVETFLAALLAAMLREEGVSEPDIDVQLEIPFLRRIKTAYHSRLGGQWDVTQSKSIVGQWFEETYKLRNRVTHAGVEPALADVHAALGAAQALREYIVVLVRSRSTQYPVLQTYFHSPAT